MRRELVVNDTHLYFPIKIGETEKQISIFVKKEEQLEKIREFMIPVRETEFVENQEYPYDFLAPLSLENYAGEMIVIEGEVKETFLNAIQVSKQFSKQDDQTNTSPLRPALHFTASNGWINDPNGLVYAEGIYHLYYQYNPFNVTWQNMSWGHAISRDLLSWEELEPVMYPDENGMMFSGCALINEKSELDLDKNALLFFYSAAGSANAWSNGKEFTQRIAYSLDGGKTLTKTDRGILDTIKKENRDPKIFWHEETSAYIMVLWLEKNDFAILRSSHLEDWEMTQVLTLKDAWECPDLLRLPVENYEEKWIFWSADGFYYVGDFDGYQFTTDGEKREAYTTKLPYAAQTYAGIDRVISVSWLRMTYEGRNYTGAMAIPKELGLVKKDGIYYLTQKFVKELEDRKKLVTCKCTEHDTEKNHVKDYGIDSEVTGPLYIKCSLAKGILTSSNLVNSDTKDSVWNIDGNVITYNRETGIFKVNEEEITLEKNLEEFTLLLDDTIFEVGASCGIISAAFELKNEAEHSSTNEMGNRISTVNVEKLTIYTL